ncbi:TPA: hypothetical protein JD322_001336 [Citrobacter freundii]|uniref:hypothetical protein n=1 Tax=Citrobacter europaeus TaxID=1914243 RepID=UPI001A2DF1CB|nr:hypothetical protein [Citrobacter freundii]
MKIKNELSREFHEAVIFDLKEDLLRLEGNLSNTSLLLSFQFKIIKHILKCERIIKRLKSHLIELKKIKRKGGLQKEQSILIKERMKNVDECIENMKFKIYIFKMFGDGVVFLYLDKFDVKHCFYNVVDYSPKELAGALGGKNGLKEEWNIVKDACSAGFPALLNDITMSMRHGDVCLLSGGVPVLVEVKSSQNKNSRVERQKVNLQKLGGFLSEDKAENFRGFPLIARMELCIPEVTYKKEINEQLVICRSQGNSWVKLEEGFYVISIRDGNIGDLLSKLDLSGGQMAPIFLNECKNNQSWIPLTPFVNLINNPSDLCDFINGDLTILCILDLDCFKDIARNEGFELIFINDDDYSMLFKEFDSSLIWGLSWQMMLRVPLEMMSMSWLIRDSITRFRQLQEQDSVTFSSSEINALEPSPLEKYRHLFLK